MGSLTNLLRQATGADTDEKAQKERMELLLVAAKAKIEKFRSELDAGFTNPALIEKTQVPGIRAIRYIEQYHVAASTKFSDQVDGHLNEAIDAFFSIGGNTDTKKAIQGGIKALIQTGLSAFIGTTEVGETMERMYFVVPENNAFVRADVLCWKYHMTQQKLLNQSDTAVAYVLCKSVIDHTQLKLDELIYLVTQALSQGVFVPIEGENKIPATDAPASADKWADQLKVLGYEDQDAKALQACVAQDGQHLALRADLDSNSDEYKNSLKPWKDVVDLKRQGITLVPHPVGSKYRIDLNYAMHPIDTSTGVLKTNPASLAVVEAYIDEMVRVWKKLEADR